MNFIKKWMIIAKFWTFPINILPLTVGAILHISSFDYILYFIMAIGLVSANFLANILNDIFDYRHGVDKLTDIAVVKRIHPLLTGMASEKQLIKASLILFTVSLLCGVYIALIRGIVIIFAGIFGAAVAFFYTASRRSIKSLGLGEVFVFIVYGPVITIAANFVESGKFSFIAMVASIPIGMIIAMILLANNIRDIKADSDAGVKTLVVRIGEKSAKKLFYVLIVAIYVIAIAMFQYRLVSRYVVITLLSAPYAYMLVGKIASKRIPHNVAEIASRFAVVFGSLFIIGIML
jgi:1,4-dihydroxy-2-naphthoate octaprenyltransferase